MAKKTKNASPKITALEHVYLPTGKFGEVWRFLGEIAGGKAGDTWTGDGGMSGHMGLGGVDFVVGSEEEKDEDQELGYPVKHGSPVLYFSTPNVDALYHALANRGASILRGPKKTHWGAKFLSVRAGEYTLAFVEKNSRAKKKGK